ncbi:MAG: 23S rRNA (pseudouridine(1915)-N(3))-methyltransferase RlmH [Porphyromonadaceae bacterium]|nr:23S rRNA (pseudouridine(1915)-N(3))-methyltransferase RlmH [Porphyromonadaceae bacterium]
MKIDFLVVGKTAQSGFARGITEYEERVKHYIPFEMSVIPDLKNTKNLTAEQQKEREGEQILKSLCDGDWMVLLDERGKEYTSLQFAGYIEKKMQTIPRRLVFVAGGPYGFSPKVYAAAQEKISLSKMTFSHQMIRLLFIEQLYRAFTILNHEPYHHV